jgi:signal transduction histidine kinase
MTTEVKKDIRTNFVSGGGEMGALISGFKWETTSLGPIDTWSQSLKTSVNLILNSTQPMWLGWGKENIFIYNDPYIEVLGLAKHAWALGKPAHVVWSEVWDFCGPLSDKVYNEGKASFVNNVHLFMNRGDFLEEVFYSFSYSPIYDEHGRVSGLFCPNEETTAKMLGERRLKTLSELSARALVEKTIDSALEKAADTIKKNREDIPFAAIFVVDSQGQPVLNASLGLTGPAFPDNTTHATAVIKTGKPEVIDLQDIQGLPSGLANQKIKEAIVLPLTVSASEPPVGVLIAGINPTRKFDGEYRTFLELVAGQVSTAYQNAVAAENERRRAEMLAEINDAKTTFFSNISHEFRTPLTLMLGPLEELLRQPDHSFSLRDRQNIETTHRNAMRLLRLVNSLLDFSRIESGRPDLHFEKIDLARYTADLASTFRSIIENAGLHYNVSCEKIDRAVYVDKGMWEKVVFNLLSNAFKYTLSGGITVKLFADKKNAVLSVEDTGVGIPAKELPHMFERFHRIKNTAGRSYEGTGIGLSLVNELVRLHGGTIAVDSTEQVGTTFTVTIPLGNQHIPAEKIMDLPTAFRSQLSETFISEAATLLPRPTGAGSRETNDASDPATARQPSILIVDDNGDMLAYLSRLLEDYYQVSTAANGQQALDSIRADAPDLILSDIMMPVMNGIELLMAVKETPSLRNTPVILLSARAGEESRIEGYDIGADDYLVKPFSAKELLARIRSQLKLAQSRKKVEEREQRLEIQVAERTNELVQKNKELESFNYIASHDLQEPLRKIQTFTELLGRSLQDERLTGFYLEKIRASAQRMSELIRSVLTYSKLSATDELFTATNLNEVLTNVLTDFEVLIEDKKARILSDLLPTIPAIPLQMQQLFANLISNALKFSGADPIITISAMPEGNFLRLTFSDNGIGFEPQFKEKIFQLFQRLHGRHEYSGTGVGLSICKKIVERHHGSITAEPNPDGGASFIILLPLTPSPRSSTRTSPETVSYH